MPSKHHTVIRSKMNKLLLFTLSALFVQLCRADLAEDTEDALNALRKTTSDNLNGGFLEHTKMSMEVDTVALDTKEAGAKILKATSQEFTKHFARVRLSSPAKIQICQETLDRLVKEASDDLNACVDMHASEAIDVIYTASSGLTDETLKQIYDEEKALIVCGRADEDCLNGVIKDITAASDGLPDLISGEIEVDRKNVEKHIEGIKSCAKAVGEKVESFGKQCVH